MALDILKHSGRHHLSERPCTESATGATATMTPPALIHCLAGNLIQTAMLPLDSRWRRLRSFVQDRSGKTAAKRLLPTDTQTPSPGVGGRAGAIHKVELASILFNVTG